MKITREVALYILDEIAEELAKQLGYDQISYKDIDCGFWDMEHAGPLGVNEDGTVIKGWEKGSMSKFLKKKYGEMIEYKYHKAMPKGEEYKYTINSGDYVGIRFMWGMPCISVHKGGNSVMGELEIGKKWLYDENGNAVLDEKGYHEYSDEYEVNCLHCFKEAGIAWGNDLHRRWDDKVSRLKEKDLWSVTETTEGGSSTL